MRGQAALRQAGQAHAHGLAGRRTRAASSWGTMACIVTAPAAAHGRACGRGAIGPGQVVLVGDGEFAVGAGPHIEGGDAGLELGELRLGAADLLGKIAQFVRSRSAAKRRVSSAASRLLASSASARRAGSSSRAISSPAYTASPSRASSSATKPPLCAVRRGVRAGW